MEKIDDCDICSLLPMSDPVLETEYWVASMGPEQGYLGRAYVTLKVHKGDMAELTDDEWLDFSKVVKKLESSIKSAFNPQLFNWTCLMNNAFQHKPALPHVHWHLRPRYENTVNFDGINFVDPLFGYHYDRGQSNIVPDETLAKIVAAVKEFIS